MRLLFLTNLYPPHGQGGYEEWCQEVAIQLRKRGHEVIVLTSRHGGDPDTEDAGWVRRELHLEMQLASLRNGFQFFTSRQQRTKENFETLRSIIRRFQPEAIMVWGMWNIVRSLPILAEKLLPGRVVYYMGDYWPTLPSQFEFYWKAPAKHWYTKVPKSILGFFAGFILSTEELPRPDFAQVIFPTIFMRNELVKRGIKPRESVVIYGAADTAPYLQGNQATHHAGVTQTSDTRNEAMLIPADKYLDTMDMYTAITAPPNQSLPRAANTGEEPPSPFSAKAQARQRSSAPAAVVEKVTLLWAGRLRSDKGVHTAIKAVGRVIQEHGLSQVELLIAGTGEPDYLTFLHYLIRKQQLQGHVTFLGQQQKEAMPMLYQQADIFLFTSVWQEPFGRVLIEAMASGATVIGSTVGGVAEILVNEQNSLTFPPNDDEALAAQIVRLIHSPELRHRLAEAGRRVALEEFDLQRMVQEIEFYLKRLVRRADVP